jgi:hypothetical protein
MTTQEDDSRDEAFIASCDDPQVRNDVARGVVFECRRIMLRQIASASREHNEKLVESLKTRLEGYDNDLREIYAGDTKTIDRALTEYVKFVKEFKRQNDIHKPLELNGPK